MPKTFEEVLSDQISERLIELDEVNELWIKYVNLRPRLQSLVIVRAYAHLEGGIKEGVNYYLSMHRTKQVGKLSPSYWLWRERSTIDEAIRSVKLWNQTTASKAVLKALKPKQIKLIETKYEYNQMYGDKIAEIYLGLGLETSVIDVNSITIDDLVRKRHLVAHGTGVLPTLNQQQLRKYRDVVDDVLTDLWEQLRNAYPDGLRR